MTNYKYLKENNLFEAHLRFKRAIGEALGYNAIEEAGDDENQNQQQGGAPGDPMGGMPPAPDAMGGGAPGAAPGGDMGGDPMGGMPPAPDAMGGQDPNGGMPDGNTMAGGADAGADPMASGMPPESDPMEEEEPEEEDDVIDVQDLTDAQEEVNDKVNSVGRDLGRVDSRIDKLLGAIETLQGMFDKNNQEIADLKKEFEKRNPTQTEKLNLRSLDSYPFKIRPTDFWNDKAEEGRYDAYADNREPTTNEYVITNNDVDDFTEREIEDTFSVDDDLDQNIKKIFGL